VVSNFFPKTKNIAALLNDIIFITFFVRFATQFRFPVTTKSSRFPLTALLWPEPKQQSHKAKSTTQKTMKRKCHWQLIKKQFKQIRVEDRARWRQQQQTRQLRKSDGNKNVKRINSKQQKTEERGRRGPRRGVQDGKRGWAGGKRGKGAKGRSKRQDTTTTNDKM